MSKVAQYGLAGIFTCLALSSYLSFLAQRDAKMFLTPNQFLQDHTSK